LDQIIDALLTKLQKDLDVDEKIAAEAGKQFFTFQEQHQESREFLAAARPTCFCSRTIHAWERICSMPRAVKSCSDACDCCGNFFSTFLLFTSSAAMPEAVKGS